MFSGRTYESILGEMLTMAPEDIDTRQGSVFFNHVAPVAFMLARYYSEMQITVDLILIDTAEGIYLDEKAKECGVYRVAAQPCIRYGLFEGGSLAENMRFFADGYYFHLIYNEDGVLVLQSEERGEIPNHLLVGATLIPVETVQGLTSAALGGIITLGAEEESDTNLRRRLREKIAGPAMNGNTQHYKSWCESVNGVALARVDPLWDGVNTVRAIIVGTDGLGAVEATIEDVQMYVDPGGLGIGEGVASIGAHFSAITAINIEIDVSCNVQLTEGTTLGIVEERLMENLTEYFANMSLSSRDKSHMTARTAAISNVIYDTEGIVDYADLTIDGGIANIIIPYTHAPKMGVLAIAQIQ